MGRERVWIGNVNAKQRQLEQRRDVDCSQSVKPRGRKNALINSARNGARTNAPDYTNITKYLLSGSMFPSYRTKGLLRTTLTGKRHFNP
ncbi:hypothetical protein V1478_018614 [Vespula squamosa]|uniref:Uncharacterized protein n=1 Tax=Vespula squamosa TaxID=30214 RepID=A0ABD1ZTB0_VESSQ